MNRNIYSNLALALTFGAPPAQAVIIDFEVLKHEGDNIEISSYLDRGTYRHGSSYSEDGFTLTAINSGFDSVATQERAFSGSTALFNGKRDGATVLTKDDGGTFDLISIALSELHRGPPVSVRFDGAAVGRATISQTFTLVGVYPPTAQTFLFNNSFLNVSSVKWWQNLPLHQFDNIVIADPPTLLPEPASLGLMGLGLVGIGFMRKQQLS